MAVKDLKDRSLRILAFQIILTIEWKMNWRREKPDTEWLRCQERGEK